MQQYGVARAAVLNVGGNWNNDDNAGLWYANGNNNADNYNSNYGGRILIYKMVFNLKHA